MKPCRSRARSGAALLALGAASALVIAPATMAAALTDAPDADAQEPETPEVVLPDEEQVDQLPEEPVEPVPTAEPAPDDGSSAAEPAAESRVAGRSTLSDAQVAAAEPIEGYYGTRKVHPVVTAEPAPTASPAPDLTTTFTLLSEGGVEPDSEWTVTTGSDGTMFFGVQQPRGATLTLTMTTPPAGYMIPADAVHVVEPCVVEVEDDACPSVTLPFTVVEQYRRLGVVAATSDGVTPAGVEIALFAPPAGADDELPDDTAPGDDEGDLLFADPGTLPVATAVTDAAGTLVFEGTLPPGPGYLVVPTAVPDGFVLPEPVLVDLEPVTTVPEADVPVMVPLVLEQDAPPPPPDDPDDAADDGAADGGAPGPGTSVGGGSPSVPTLPATGAESRLLALVAASLVMGGALSLRASRRMLARA